MANHDLRPKRNAIQLSRRIGVQRTKSQNLNPPTKSFTKCEFGNWPGGESIEERLPTTNESNFVTTKAGKTRSRKAITRKHKQYPVLNLRLRNKRRTTRPEMDRGWWITMVASVKHVTWYNVGFLFSGSLQTKLSPRSSQSKPGCHTEYLSVSGWHGAGTAWWLSARRRWLENPWVSPRDASGFRNGFLHHLRRIILPVITSSICLLSFETLFPSDRCWWRGARSSLPSVSGYHHGRHGGLQISSMKWMILSTKNQLLTRSCLEQSQIPVSGVDYSVQMLPEPCYCCRLPAAEDKFELLCLDVA